MKKNALLLAGFAFLAACSSAPKDKTPAYAADCVFPNTSEAAPVWICNAPVDGIDVSSVGIAEKSAAGISFMTDIAAADARGKLVDQFKVRVDKMVKSYFGTTGEGDAETVDRAAESVLKTVSSEILIGSKIYRSRTGPNGRLFVLVGLDAEATQKAAEESLKTSMNNDQALWQKFQAQKGFDELKEEIASQKVQ